MLSFTTLVASLALYSCSVIASPLELSPAPVDLSPRDEKPPKPCVDSGPSPNSAFSYYNFTVDPWVKERAFANGLVYLGVRQHCRGEEGGGPKDFKFESDTENWSFVPFDKFAPETYRVEVKRCKKRFDRWAHKYKLHLCSGTHKKHCHSWCGTDVRNCGTIAKAIDVVDPNPFECWAPDFPDGYVPPRPIDEPKPPPPTFTLPAPLPLPTS